MARYFFWLSSESDGTLFRLKDGRWDMWNETIRDWVNTESDMSDENMTEIWPEMAEIIMEKGYVD